MEIVLLAVLGYLAFRDSSPAPAIENPQVPPQAMRGNAAALAGAKPAAAPPAPAPPSGAAAVKLEKKRATGAKIAKSSRPDALVKAAKVTPPWAPGKEGYGTGEMLKAPVPAAVEKKRATGNAVATGAKKPAKKSLFSKAKGAVKSGAGLAKKAVGSDAAAALSKKVPHGDTILKGAKAAADKPLVAAVGGVGAAQLAKKGK